MQKLMYRLWDWPGTPLNDMPQAIPSYTARQLMRTLKVLVYTR